MENIHIEICPVCGGKDFSNLFSCKDNFATQEHFDLCSCNSCKFTFTQNFPSEKIIGKYYESPEYISHTNTQKGIINSLYHIVRKITLKSKADLIQKCSGKSNGNLLDIGAGTGYFLNEMANRGWQVTGIEKSLSAREYIKKNFGLDCFDSEHLSLIEHNSMDVVTMWHVLEHMEKPDTSLSSIYSILKSDGTAVIALPNADSRDAKHYRKHWAAYDVPRHLWHFSPDTFRMLAEKHNFEVVSVKPMHFDTFYISMLSEKNKKTPLGSIIGLVKGGLFWTGNLYNARRCSSLIYILKKK